MHGSPALWRVVGEKGSHSTEPFIFLGALCPREQTRTDTEEALAATAKELHTLQLEAEQLAKQLPPPPLNVLDVTADQNVPWLVSNTLPQI